MVLIVNSSCRSAKSWLRNSCGSSSDAAYIRKLIDVGRKLELGSRAVLLFSLFPPAWLVGTAGLAVAKILENMEIGHNVMHGQWDWMRDPKIHSAAWEWDHASPADLW
jgi:fatty acid desaturase